MKHSNNLKIGVAGIRGIVGESLTPALASSFAASFGRYVGGNSRVIIGRDTRESGIMLENAVVAGLLAVGCQPVLLGVIPTPTVQLMVREYNASGGIAITASHNPAEWNALKFIGAEGIFLDHNETEELLDIYNQGDFSFVEESEYRNIRKVTDAFAVHQEKIFLNIDVAAIKEQHFKVAVDCCNGVGAVYTRGFLEKLGCRVVTIFDNPSGIFERDAEPIVKNLGMLAETVKKYHCNLGFAHDPDGDRMALVDSRGVPVGEQNTLVLAFDHILSESPGEIAVNIQTTRAAEDVARIYGCEVHYAKVGEVNVIAKMIEVGAQVGGEGNCGGLIWRKIHPCRDSYVSMAIILEMLALSGQSLEDVLAELPHYSSRSVKFPCPAAPARSIVQELSKEYADKKPCLLDGLKLDIGNSRILIRPSNTEPVLRLFVESPTEAVAVKMLRQFSLRIENMMREKNISP